jgi:hypothetical protein
MIINIQEPWWGSWKTYGWAKGIWGIGIATDDVELAILKKEPLLIRIHNFKEKYKVSPVTVKNYSLKNNTIYRAKFNKELYVIPQTELEKENK